MTTATTNGAAKRVRATTPKAVEPPPVLGADAIDAIVKLATDVATERFRAEAAEVKLARLSEHEGFAELKAKYDALQADLLELNRCLNYYGGRRGWCPDYENILGKFNARFTVAELRGRSGYTVLDRNRLALTALPPEDGWEPPEF
jgi:hypothetical protein